MFLPSTKMPHWPPRPLREVHADHVLFCIPSGSRWRVVHFGHVMFCSASVRRSAMTRPLGGGWMASSFHIRHQATHNPQLSMKRKS